MSRLRPLPGPIGLPFVGSALSLGDNPTKSMLRWARDIYGPVYLLTIGSRKVLAVQGYEAMHECMVENGEDYLGRPQWDLSRAMRDGDGIFFRKPDQGWRRWRKFAKDGLHKIKEHTLLSFMGETKYALETFAEIAERGEPVVLGKSMLLTMANGLLETIFSTRFDMKNEDFAHFISQLYKEVESTNFPNLMFFPWLRYIPSIGRYMQEADERRKFMIGRLSKMIKEHGYDRHKNDLANLFYKENPTPDEATITSFGFLVEDFMYAGIVSNKFSATWALLFLMKSPDKMAKLQKEMDLCLDGREDAVNAAIRSNFEGLNYLKATVDEANRMRPVAVFRETLRDTKVMGYKVPGDILVFPNLWSVHHDEKLFPNSETFTPERFINSDGQYEASKYVIPFNLGVRKCPGYDIAFLGVRTYLLTLLYHYDVELMTSLSEKDLEGKQQPAASPPDHQVKLKRRRKGRH